jgi:hypothetical protein
VPHIPQRLVRDPGDYRDETDDGDEAVHAPTLPRLVAARRTATRPPRQATYARQGVSGLSRLSPLYPEARRLSGQTDEHGFGVRLIEPCPFLRPRPVIARRTATRPQEFGSDSR